ncbi:unnamed protein product [Lactuca saligna]|uniref:Glucan endo-1,3-beta-D-glucosidase n=1 Tax=Lactuca saligna TaxID=75948 RepID=A0AA35YL91_LACSI|nr:unnamed protein product [Lactuca saligna]
MSPFYLLPYFHHSYLSLINIFSRRTRIYDADHEVLKAFKGSGIEIIIGLGNEFLRDISKIHDRAMDWMKNNIETFVPGNRIRGIAVGNEVLGVGDQDLLEVLLPEVKNIHTALDLLYLADDVEVSIPHYDGLFASSFPPSLIRLFNEIVIEIGRLNTKDEVGWPHGNTDIVCAKFTSNLPPKSMVIHTYKSEMKHIYNILNDFWCQFDKWLSLSFCKDLGFADLQKPQAELDGRVCAAVRQNGLMELYDTLFILLDMTLAQLLMTDNDFRNSKFRKQLMETVDSLLSLEVIPIFKENHSISTRKAIYKVHIA